jgi:MFS family permease
VSWGQPPDEGGRDDGWGDDGRSRDDGRWGSQPDRPSGTRDPQLRRDPQLGRDPKWGRDPDRDALRPLNLGDVLDGMFRIAGRHWQAFAIAVGIIVVPLAVLSSVSTIGAVGDMRTMVSDVLEGAVTNPGAPPDPANFAMAGSAALLSGLASALLTPLLYGIAVQVAAHGYRVGEVDAMAAVRAAGSRYGSLLGVTILIWLAVAAAFAVAPIIVGLLLAIAGAGESTALGLMVLAVIVGIVAAIVVLTRLSLAVPALMVERAAVTQAMRRSNELVRGGAGRLFGILLLVGIIVSIVTSVMSLPFQIALFVPAVPQALGLVLATAGAIVANLLRYSLLAVAFVLLYFDRRVRTEGYDLSELARELGQHPRPPW